MIGGRYFRLSVSTVLAASAALCTGCSGGRRSSAPSTATTAVRPSPAATSAQTAVATGTLSVVISGGGRGTIRLTDLRCDPTQVSATAASGGRVELDRIHAVLRLTGVAPIGTATFTGSASAVAPASAAPITFRGTATGMSAALTAQC